MKNNIKENGFSFAQGKIMIVPLGFECVFQCQRGFWWGTKLSCDITPVNIDNNWLPNKIPLHVKTPKYEAARTTLSTHWESRVFKPSLISVDRSKNVVIEVYCD
jgi:hypothetical protein